MSFCFIFLKVILYPLSSIAASSSFQETVMDPCIPKGYNQSTSPNITLNKSEKQLPTTNSMGNFSACRSVALSLLQKGQGKIPSSLLPFTIFLMFSIFLLIHYPSKGFKITHTKTKYIDYNFSRHVQRVES